MELKKTAISDVTELLTTGTEIPRLFATSREAFNSVLDDDHTTFLKMTPQVSETASTLVQLAVDGAPQDSLGFSQFHVASVTHLKDD